MNAKRIGSFLKELRQEKQITQRDIAQLCHLSAQAVSKWEKGDSIPDVEQLQRLSVFYGVSINEILSGERQIYERSVNNHQYLVRMVLSIVVFLAFAFNYVKIELTQGFGWIDLIYRGYELILDGVGGGLYIITMIIFVLLITQFLLHLLMTLKAFEPHDVLEFYIFCTTLLVMIVSAIKLSFESFYPFPQIWIMLTMSALLLVQLKNRPELSALKAYRNYEKTEEIPKELSLPMTPNTSVILKKARIHYLVLTISYVALAAFLALGFVDSLIQSSQHSHETARVYFLVGSMVTLILALTLAYFYAAIGSFHSSKLLAVAAFLAALMVFSGFLTGPPIALLTIAIGLYSSITLSVYAYRLNQVRHY